MSGKETYCSGALSVKETCCHWARLQQPTKIWHLCKRARKDQAYPKKPLPSDAAAYPHCNTRLHTNETNLCGTVCCSVLQCVEHHVCIVVHGVGVNGVGIQGRGAQDDKPKTRHCNTLLYSAINCNTLQHTATDCGHGMHGVVHQGRFQGVGAQEGGSCCCWGLLWFCCCHCCWKRFRCHSCCCTCCCLCCWISSCCCSCCSCNSGCCPPMAPYIPPPACI